MAKPQRMASRKTTSDGMKKRPKSEGMGKEGQGSGEGWRTGVAIVFNMNLAGL